MAAMSESANEIREKFGCWIGYFSSELYDLKITGQRGYTGATEYCSSVYTNVLFHQNEDNV